MAIEVLALRNTGPTDRSGDDTLWVGELSEGGGPAEQFRFTLAARFGVPTVVEMGRLIMDHLESGLAHDRPLLAQLREREIQHPGNSDRLAIVLRPA